MNEKSFISRLNYFDRLKHKSCKIDEGINSLAETWNTPHLLIGGYAERTATINAYLEEVSEALDSTDNAVEKFQSELEPSLKEMDCFLEKSEEMYKNLKEQCDNLDIVLAEYGYHYEENDNVLEKSHRNDEDHINYDTLKVEETSEVEVEFTPDMKWKCKAKSKETDISNMNQKNPPITSIATPVIKSLKSVLQADHFIKK
nr:PREDICTED: uncharacterized protein LOC105678975 [Linepithema humile]